jgi:hypothetical protein
MRDIRRYAQQTNIRLFIGFLLILFIIGIGLIYIFWGWEAALLGLICMILGLSPMILIWLALFIIGWVVRKADPDE